MSAHHKITAEDIERAKALLDRARDRIALGAVATAPSHGNPQGHSSRVGPSFPAHHEPDDERASAFVAAYLLGPEPGVPPLLALGLQTLRMAIEAPERFNVAAEWVRRHQGAPPPPPVIAVLRADPRLAHVADDQLARLNALLWVLSEGLVASARSTGPTSVEALRPLLVDAGEALISHVLSSENPE